MDFEHSPTATRYTELVREFMDSEVIPHEQRYNDEIVAAGDPYAHPLVMDELRAKAKANELWNLFLPDLEWGGAGLSNLDFAPVCEEMGRSLIGPEVFNCEPPDSGNIGLLADFGTPEQQDVWLKPLLEGTIASAFSMTEPDVASSDANNIRTRIDRDGDEYVINGIKGPTTGAARARCRVTILVGVTDAEGDPARRQSLVLVPLDAPGVEIVRTWTVFGYHQPISQAEVRFTDVRVPVANLIQGEGDGFRMSQARLGPGRIHHCMRAIGMAERALELMCQRVASRETFGARIADHGVMRDWIARSRLEIEQARLLTLKAAWKMDNFGNHVARKEIAEIKIVVPQIVINVVDRAVQSFGAAGMTQLSPLAEFWTSARTLRILDGPDEVHIRSLARWELASQLKGRQPADVSIDR